MPNTYKYTVGKDVYDIPTEERDKFEKQYPDAKIGMYGGGEYYDIPLSEVDNFINSFADAQFEVTEDEGVIGKMRNKVSNTLASARATGEEAKKEQEEAAQPEPAVTDVKPSVAGKDHLVVNPISKESDRPQPTEQKPMQLQRDPAAELGLMRAANRYAPEPPKTGIAGAMERIRENQEVEAALNSDAGEGYEYQGLFGKPGIQMSTAAPMTDEEKAEANKEALDAAVARDRAREGSLERELNEAYAERERLRKQIEEGEQDTRRYGGASGYPTTAQVAGWGNTDLDAAYRQVQDRINILEAKRDGGNAWNDFWRGFGNAITDLDLLTFGASEMGDALRMLKAKESSEGNGLSEEQQELLKNVVLTNDMQAKYGDDLGFLYTAGNITANAIPFMVEFMATGGGFGVGAAIEKGVTRAVAKAATKGLQKHILKALGSTAADIATAAVMANTTGAARTYSDIVNRYIGNPIMDEEGNYSFEGGKSIGQAIYEGEIANSLEYYTEMLGNRMEGPVMAWLAKKGGLSKIADLYGSLTSSSRLGKSIGTLLRAGGINSLPNEGLEEEANIILNSLLVGDNQFSDLWDAKTQRDIWGGMLFSVGSMSAMQVLGDKYGTYKEHNRLTGNLNAASAKAGESIGKDWQDLKDKMDATSNDDFANLAGEITGNENLTPQQKRDALEYMGALAKLRGFNTMTVINAREEANRFADRQDAMSTALKQGYDRGMQAFTQQDGDPHKIRVDVEASAQNVAPNVRQTIDGLIDNDASPQEMTDFVMQLPEDQREGAMTYIEARSSLYGMQDAANDDVQKLVASEREAITPNIQETTDDEGNVHKTFTTVNYNGQTVYVRNYDPSSPYIHIVDPETGEVRQIIKGQDNALDESSIQTYEYDQYMSDFERRTEDAIGQELEGRMAHNRKTNLQMEQGSLINSENGQMYVFSNDGETVQLLPTQANAETNQIEPVSGQPVTMKVDDAVAMQDAYNDGVDYGVPQAEAEEAPVEEAQQEELEEAPVEEAAPVPANAETAVADIRTQMDNAGLSEAADAIDQGRIPSMAGMTEEQQGLALRYMDAVNALADENARRTETQTAAAEPAKPTIPVDRKTGVKLYEQGVELDDAIEDIKKDGFTVSEVADISIAEAQKELEKVQKKVDKGAQTREELYDSRSDNPKTEYGKSLKRAKELQGVIDYYTRLKAREEELGKPAQEELENVAKAAAEETLPKTVEETPEEVASEQPAAETEAAAPVEEPQEETKDPLIEAYEREQDTVDTEGGLVGDEVAEHVLPENWRGALHSLGRHIGRRIVILSDKSIRERGYDPDKVSGYAQGNTVYISERAAKDNGRLRSFIAGHELTHMLKTESPEVWNAFVQSVKTAMGDDFAEEFAAVKKKYDDFYDAYNEKAEEEGRKKLTKLTDDEIDEEVCCNWAGRHMLQDVDAVRNIVEEAANAGADPKSLIKKVLDWINGMLESLKAALKRGEDVADSIDAFNTAKKIWQDMYNIATAKNNARKEAEAKRMEEEENIPKGVAEELASHGLTVSGGAVMSTEAKELKDKTGYETPNETTEEDATKFSIATMPNWIKSFSNGDGKLSKKRVKEITGVVDLWYQMAAADDAIHDYISYGKYPGGDLNKDGKGPLRKNVEYVYTFDLDTTCPRTFQYLNYVDAIEAQLGRPMSQREMIILIESMRAMGQQIPCTYCYAENKRQALKQYYLNFIGYRNNVLNAKSDEEAKKAMYGLNSKGEMSEAAQKVFERWRGDDPLNSYRPSISQLVSHFNQARNIVLSDLDMLYEANAVNPDMSDAELTELMCERYRINQSTHAKAQAKSISEIINEWRYDTIEGTPHKNFTEMSGMHDFNLNALALWDEMRKYGASASSAKNVVKYYPYTDELQGISKKDRDYINGMGGLRMHSTNDFRIDYVGDYFQLLADMAKGGWMGHTYTKNPDFVRIFGNTGYRINMSIAAYDIDGKVEMNQEEGFNWEEVKKLREQFPNAGTMFMTTSRNQLQYALDADWVDMIIPFHASSLPKEVWYNMRKWEDATTVQNESFFNSKDKKDRLQAKGVDIPKGASAEEIDKLYDKTFKPIKLYDNTAEMKYELKEVGQKVSQGISYDELKKQYIDYFGHPCEAKGKRIRPHFLPGETKVGGNTIPGWHVKGETEAQGTKRYLELCEQYGVRPRFYGVKVNDKDGNEIDVTEHPNYVKLIKETSRMDTEQTPIEFNLDKPNPALDEWMAGKNESTGESWTPMEYAMAKLREFAQQGGYSNLKEDPYGVVDDFMKNVVDYERETGKQRPLDYISPDARMMWNIIRKGAEAAAMSEKELMGDVPYHPADNAEPRLSLADPVNSKEFKEWFGDSKVVDKKGKPKVMWHGTKATFNTFRYNPDDIGFHFGNKSAARTRVGRGKDTRLLPVYIRLSNPIELTDDLGAFDGEYLAPALLNKGIITEDEYNNVWFKDGWKRGDRYITRDLRTLLLSKGYDGISYPNYYESDGSTSYIVFEPNQVKLAKETTYDNNGNVIPLSERFNNNTGDIRFSLSTEIEAQYPNWMDNQTPEVEGKRGQNTQVAGTVGTYKKVGKWIEDNLGKDAKILDASSGLGLGTQELRKQGFDVEDIEPYPGKGRDEQPTYGGLGAYQRAMDDGKQYDYIISNAVLNVIPDDWRNGVLHDMATLLKEGGKMFINTRKAGEEKTIKNKIELESPQEVLVGTPDKITSYQRFFTPQELKKYVQDELGKGYTVTIANEKNSGTKGLAAVVVTKESPDGGKKTIQDILGTESVPEPKFSLGVPYQGSKNRVAKKIVDKLPSGKRFVDLFSGGGAVTHAAMLSGKYGQYRMNDINPVGQDLFMQGVRGEWRDYDKDSMTDEEFGKIKGTPEALPWSYNGLGRNLAKNKDDRNKAQEQIRRVKSLESLKEYADDVETSADDYRNVKVQDGDVVYADIPYEGTDQLAYRNGTFDKQEFVDWAQAQDFPIYVSEYSMPDGWVEVASFDVPGMRGGSRKEKLFVQEKFSEGKPKKKETTIQDILGTNKEEPRFSLRGEVGAANDPDAMANLSVAKDMDKEKRSAKSIWLATGWEKGADGKWRNEIPDVKAKPLDFDNVETIEDIVDAPELFAAYPQLKDYKVQFTKMKNAGSINHDDKLIKLDKDYNTDYSLSDEDQKELNERTMDYIRNGNWRGEGDIVRFKRNWIKKHGVPHIDKEGIKTIAHELQHAVQGIEGFARGGSVSGMAYEYLKELAERDPELSTFAKEFADFMSVNDMMRSGKKAIANWLSRDDMDADDETKANLKKVADSMRDMSDAEFVDYIVKAKQLAKQARKVGEERYDRLAGEIEAKNVEDRLDMTDDERRSTPPSETEDLSRENQIVRFSISEEEETEYDKAVKDGDIEKAGEIWRDVVAKAMPNTKVLDEDGKPLVMSHHTDAQPFNKFDRSKIGTGQGQAFLGLGFNFSRGRGNSTYGSRNVQAYLNAENPLRSDKSTLSKADIRSIIEELNKKNGVDRIEDSWGSMRDAVDSMYDLGDDLGVYATIGMTYSGDRQDVMESFEKRGFDSTIEYYDDGRIHNAVVFNSNQIKLADPVTYDDNNNPIPLEQRANMSNDDIRFSLNEEESDKEYDDAVKKGDEKKERQLLNDAAKKAMPDTKVVDKRGNPLVVYHGTIDQFNVFDIDETEFGAFHFSSTREGAMGAIMNKIYERWMLNPDRESDVREAEKIAKEYARIIPAYLNIENLLRVDDNIANDIAMGRKDGDKSANSGYVYTNDVEGEGTDSYMVFNSNQIKSAELVTYDDNGEVIPLSERFNLDKNEIRFSLADDEQSKEIFDASKKLFGTTYDIREAGYVLPDGSMLDFSGRNTLDEGVDASDLKGRRLLDHRDIQQVAYEKDGNTKTGVDTDMADFISRGAIRIDDNAGLINLSNKPTAGQKEILRRLIARNDGYVQVDFGDGWDSEHYVEYNGDKPSKVLSDIDKYYDEGIKPQPRFSISDTPFYSNAEKAVEGIKQDKATPEQWLKMIEKAGGLKAGEDKWMGLSDWLKGNDKKSLTKQEVLDYIRENQVRVDEVRYENGEGDNTEYASAEEEKEYQDIYDSLIRQGEYDFKAQDEAIDALRRKYGKTYTHDGASLLVVNSNPINSTRLLYTTEGLDNKKEIALVVPTIESWNEGDQTHFGDAGNGRAVAWIRFGETTAHTDEYYAAKKAADDYLAEMREKYGVEEGEETDRMTDEEIKHLQELTGKEVAKYDDKNRVLVIDEIQSKRHQEGREKGYRDESEVERLRKEYDETYNALSDAYEKLDEYRYQNGELMDDAEGYDELSEKVDNLQKRMRDLEEELRLARRRNAESIPDAPFEKNWHELAMKRMLRYAAENGYDKVAWTKGAQQADRYSLSKTIPSITRNDTKKASDKGIRIFEMDINGEPQKVFVNNDGTITNTTMFMDEVSGKPLSDFVGKEIAVKMMTMKDGETIDTSKEKVGGEGMKGFYDEILPRFMNKFDKKWGVKVGEVELPNVEEAGRTMWSVDVTPEMKESVMQGQPMFSLADEDRTAVESYDAGEPTFVERLTNSLLELQNRNEENTVARMNAISSIGARLSDINKAMRAQKEYDKGTVDSLVRLAKMLLAQTKTMLKPDEQVKIWNALAKVVGKKDTTQEANRVVDVLVDSELRTLKGLLDKIRKTKGVKLNSSGVETMGRLDIIGQRLVNAFNDGLKMKEEDLQNQIAETNMRLYEAESSTERESIDAELRGLELAQRYHEEIGGAESTIAGIRSDINAAKEDPESVGISKGKERADYIRELQQRIRDEKISAIPALASIVADLSGEVKAGKTRAKMMRDEDLARKQEIWHDANSDLLGVPNDSGAHKKTVKEKWAENRFLRLALQPLATFNEMLRFFGESTARGEGRLFNRFMPQFIWASDREWRRMKENRRVIDEKLSDIMGKKTEWSDLYRMESKMPTVPVTVKEGKEEKTYDLTQGNMLYIYMANKMTDGKVKLRKMGITEEDVEALKEKIDPRFIELADWIQSEFLPSKRKEFNEVHERMYGAPMADIEDYFPLEIDKNARASNFDVKVGNSNEHKPSTVTGSVIKRTFNTVALDITRADAFDVLYNHLQDMEHWAAFAEFSRDLNTLINYPNFKKKVKNMSSLRFGSGEQILKTFEKVAQIASGSYTPTVDRGSLDSLAVNIGKGVTMAKISFRLFTAMKQKLSEPAYISEASPASLAKYGAPVMWASNFNWAIENVPGFSKRWESRQAGDYRLKRDDLDWTIWNTRLVDKLSKWGMTPNAFVDALAVAMGARAIYETNYKRMLKDGYDRDIARQRALEKATSYNETQQSSENAYLAPIQVDRTAASVGFTAFRNASMGYERRLVRAVVDLKNSMKSGYKDRAVEQIMKQAMKDGLDEEQARKSAERIYNRSRWRDIADVAIFGYGLQFLWNLGPYIVDLLFGDDDDKEKALKDAAVHALFGPIEGLTGGNVVSDGINNIINGEWYKVLNSSAGQMPIVSDIKKVMQDLQKDEYAAIVDIVHLLMSSTVGVNPANVSDWTAAIMDAGKGLAGEDGDNLKASEELTLLLLRLAEVPKSQTDKFFLDRVFGESPRDVDPERIDAMLKRYTDYKRNSTEFLLRPVRDLSDEGREKIEDKWVKRFETERKERMKALANEDDAALIEKYEKEIRSDLIKKGKDDRTAEEDDLYDTYNEYKRYFKKGTDESERPQSSVDSISRVLAGLIEKYIADNGEKE